MLYRKLSGMTGTAQEAARELWYIYHLPVIRSRLIGRSSGANCPIACFPASWQRWLLSWLTWQPATVRASLKL